MTNNDAYPDGGHLMAWTPDLDWPTDLPCPDCGGIGRVDIWDCAKCDGTGRIKKVHPGGSA